jgi:hypothetical protein
MLKSIQGIFRDGKIELLEPAPSEDDARVVVTFLPAGNAVDLRERGIDERQAADLKARLRAVREDWDRPEMDIYDAI